MDEEAGISVSIRLLHPQRVDRAHLIESGMVTEEMISFLEMCIRYGVSVVVAGRTSSGKTTLMNALLSSIPDDKRIYTIESGARELFLVKKNRFGETQNNVVHTLSRPSENDAYNITQENLVVAALRFDPDVVVVGEIRDAEANSTVEASLTGHTVVTTVHSGPAESAHGRISLLCQRRFQLGMEVSLSQSRQAFPIVVFAHKCEDNSRKVMDITECEVTPEGKTFYRCLYRYNMVSLIIQQLYREILAVADENGGKLKNRVVFYCDEFGTLPKIESAEMMFSASRSRRVSIVPIIQSLAQLEKNYGKEGAEIIVDNTQLTVFGGFAPNSETAQVLSKSLGTRTVMSGSVSQSKNDPSRSLQMIERPLMTADELKALPKGTFVVTKTGFNPIKVKLKLFFKWGIQFEDKPFVIPLRDNTNSRYANKDDLMTAAHEKYCKNPKDDGEEIPPNSYPFEQEQKENNYLESKKSVRHRQDVKIHKPVNDNNSD